MDPYAPTAVADLEPTHRRRQVLLVEDDAVVRLVAVEVITASGFDVVEAEDAGVALELLERGLAPDLLLTEVRMPGVMDGFGLARVVADRWPGIGILVCSAYANRVDGDLPPGAMFLRKPYLPNVLGRGLADLANRTALPADG